MISAHINVEQAVQMARWLWVLLMAVWVVLWFGMKRAKKLETPWEMMQHALPVMLGFWLLFGKHGSWLSAKLWPLGSIVLWIGVALTALGVAISISARATLGANWSGVVTLKRDHQLIRAGLYRWIRHPIYTGILLAFLGTELIQGELRGCLGFAIVLASFYFKARREETFLRQEFGEQFQEHLRHTGMFLPTIAYRNDEAAH
jgi:protein-S-isoprenylcysteine O-methyltransferase Ste14